MTDWKERERERQKSRTLPVWTSESFWTDHAAIHADHFVHVSQVNPPLLAYTVNDEKGKRDIQTQIKPGRYLARYFSDVLTEKQIAFLAAWQTNGTRKASTYDECELLFATEPDEIADVYQRGPSSCMDGDNFRDKATMPVRVYGAGDLAIAYLVGKKPDNASDERDVPARCLVWPDKKVMGRIYPTEGVWQQDGFTSSEEMYDARAAMTNKLRDMGYRSMYEGATFRGAKLLKLRGRYGNDAMPYIDGGFGVNDRGDHYVMVDEDNAEYACNETNGTVSDEREPDWICPRCEEEADEDSTWYVRLERGYESWCNHCGENHTFHCDGYGEDCDDEMESVEVGGATYSEQYASQNFTFSDYSEEYFDEESVTVEVNGRDQTWSQTEFDENGFECEISGRYLPNECRHVDYHEIAADCTDDEIVKWCEDNGREPPNRVEDATQEEIAL